jgi:hypothetical protein
MHNTLHLPRSEWDRIRPGDVLRGARTQGHSDDVYWKDVCGVVLRILSLDEYYVHVRAEVYREEWVARSPQEPPLTSEHIVAMERSHTDYTDRDRNLDWAAARQYGMHIVTDLTCEINAVRDSDPEAAAHWEAYLQQFLTDLGKRRVR